MRKQYHSRAVGPDTYIWDVHRLVGLSRNLPVRTVALSAISEADENWWYGDQTSIATPRSIAAHFELVQQADTRHPIILCSDGRLMDGMHRVVKALASGQDSIKAVQFEVTPQPDYCNVSLADLPYPDQVV